MVAFISSFDLAGDSNIPGKRIDQSIKDFGITASKRAIDIASQIGLEIARITETNISSELPEIVENYSLNFGSALNQLGQYGADNGVVVVVENFRFGFDQMNQILDTVGHKMVRTLFDPCNYFRVGEDPLEAIKI
jgi:sugar phosphate isomerase/epimerase